MPLPHSIAAVMTCNDACHYVYDGNVTAVGLQVAEYMNEMQEDSEENYNKHFSSFIEAELEGDDLEGQLQEVITCMHITLCVPATWLLYCLSVTSISSNASRLNWRKTMSTVRGQL